jgi:hypothetical protein
MNHVAINKYLKTLLALSPGELTVTLRGQGVSAQSAAWIFFWASLI